MYSLKVVEFTPLRSNKDVRLDAVSGIGPPTPLASKELKNRRQNGREAITAQASVRAWEEMGRIAQEIQLAL